MSGRTMIVAATNVLAQGYLVVPTDRRSRTGDPVNGLFALARAIQRVLAFKRPVRAVAVVEADLDLATWPPLLHSQLALLPELLETLGVPVVRAPDEASTVAAYTRAALAAGDDVIIVGVDKRYAQLVSDRVWWYDANKDARYTPEIVRKRFAVGPEHVAEWLALVGDDTGPGLPGVAGIGAKGATTLLETYGSVAGAVAQLASIKGRPGTALRAAQPTLDATLARARLDGTVALPAPLDELAFRPPAATPLNALYDRLGFAELLAVGDEVTPTDVITKPDDLVAHLATVAGRTVALHLLVGDPAPVRGALAGVALRAVASDGTSAAVYVPVDSAAWPVLATWLGNPGAPKLTHDLVEALVTLARMDVALAGVVADSQSASHLAQPSNWAPHDLPTLAKHVLGRGLPSDETVRGVGVKRRQWSQLPVDRAAAFAGTYADATAAAWAALAPTTEPALLAEYLDLSATCARMELTGIVVDPHALDDAEQALAAIETELATQIEALAGHPFNINSTQQLGSVLFEELELPIVSHTKTGWSTSIEALERIEHAHAIVPLVLRWRLLRRLRDSWITALRRCIDTDGRVHSRSHPARSFGGGLVNTAPDLARVPGRTPEMQRIRRAFVAAPGRLLVSLDYQQLGLYVLAHLTKDPALVEPLRAHADLHRLTAAAVLEKPLTEVTSDERQLGKVVNFGTFAGQGASALALQLGVSPAEAKAILDRFDRRYPRVAAFFDGELAAARACGYVTTLAGRHWPIGGLESLDSQDRAYAERMARRGGHQGSVADVTRRALLAADRALRAAGLAATPLVTIVDEILFEVAASDVAEAVRVAATAMRTAFVLEVPLVVGAEAGPTWAELAPIAIAPA